jgi:hypothetical protein
MKSLLWGVSLRHFNRPWHRDEGESYALLAAWLLAICPTI